tara:strand:+ start:9622 stop:10746 length:1125 start_codon:yes stop_codon:yes gene_type:complete
MGKSSANTIEVEGILDLLKNKTGQLLDPARNGKPTPKDPFVPRELVRRFKLKKGSYIKGVASADPRFPNPKLKFVETIDGLVPNERKHCFQFTSLTTIAPEQQLHLETNEHRMTLRCIDLFCPIGKGQRGLIVAPPRTGKTTLLQDIAIGVLENHKECHVIMLLVDERPEEVTDMKRTVGAEIFASSNDEPTENHIKIAELCIARAKNLVEVGRDVVILMDSLTRLSRAYNSAKGGGGRTMTGGLDIRALEKPRQLFSAARNTEEAGSLSIIASALIETGSKMDDLIFQEFKGTGNMEMVLDRKVAELRMWPAMNINSSGTRKEELLISEEKLETIHFFRRALASLKVEDAAETMISRLSKTTTNEAFLTLIRR